MVYLILFSLLRLVLKRVAGTVGLADMLLVVLIADAAQNAMASGYRSITDGILLVATIIFWNHALNWLGYRFPAFQQFFNPPPLLLVKNGQILKRNMRKEFITEDELMGELRHLGISRIEEVEKAWIEGDGRISAMPKPNRRSSK
jgi:uncharacterized membrane protein YcaP (DUF421 family)